MGGGAPELQTFQGGGGREEDFERKNEVAVNEVDRRGETPQSDVLSCNRTCDVSCVMLP
jgi:hypothetical protein